MGLIALFATIFVSVRAMAWSLLFTSVANQIINASPNKKLLGYGYKEQIKDILPAIILSVIMGILVYPIQLLGLGYLPTLLIQIPLGAFIYSVGSIILKLDSFEYLLGIVKQFLKRGK